MSETRVGSVGADELRELIDHVFAELDADERRGSLLRAAKLEVRFEITDLDLVVHMRAAEGRHHLAWDFAERAEEAEAGLSLTMDSATANGYLQGRESLAVAIARGRVRCSGDLRTTIVYLPALRLLVEPYRAWVERLHPDLALA
ncbi:MAG TPA: hypothetical protein VD766_02350 [Solirubrobacterales bacterium]|nr:hypothetical protein [Solirubrobacterales bacterium]